MAPAAAWVGCRAFDRQTALIAASIVATTPVLIEFSTNARGYSLVSLCVLIAIGIGLRLLRGGGLIAWFAWIEVGVIGLYTIPTMAVPWLGLTGWLASRLALRPRERLSSLAALVGATFVIAVVAVALYSGIIVSEGLEALLGNRFVAPEPLSAFLAGTPAEVGRILRYWARSVPLLLAALFVVGTAVGLRSDPRGSGWRGCVASLAVGVVVSLLVVRNWGEPRIWQWALPVLAITAAAGAMGMGRSRGGSARTSFAPSVAVLWAAVSVVQLFREDPVRTSLDTGTFPEAPEVAERIFADFRQGDVVMSDFVSGEPLRFYIERLLSENETAPRGDQDRAWVVVSGRDSTRLDQVGGMLDRIGAPPLAELRPFFTAGNASVYLLGRPSGAPDPRIVEAIDWHTGAAGYVDEQRARALIEEVAAESVSPLAYGWLMRCARVGCMGGQDVGAEPGSLELPTADEVLAGLRGLAAVGSAEAAFLLGSAADEGWAEAVEPEESVRWYTAAAGLGHALAARMLGAAFAQGRGVERNDSAAGQWWRRAAEAGDATAQLWLGAAYEEGSGVPRDLVAARAWYTRALERRHPEARSALAGLPPR